MKRLFLTAAALMTAISVSLPCQAGQTVISGQVNHDNTAVLTSQMSWFHSLGQAETEAMRSNKLIFWVQMLGSMDGAT
jgi:hypothetical protein